MIHDAVAHAPTEVRRLWAAMGRLYADGQLTPAQVAWVLEADVPSVIHWFEVYGFHIHPQTQILTDEQREAIANTLLAESVQRQGGPLQDASLSRRCTIASQRIEGIDARDHDFGL